MLKPGEHIFLFGHEVLHNVYEHLGRSKQNKHNPKLSNIAADYCVNRDLKDNRIGTFITTVPALYDRKYNGYSMEEVYDELYENAEKIDIEKLVDQLLDEHLDDEGDNTGSSGQPEEDENGNLVSKSKPKYTKEQRQQIRDNIKESLLQSAAGASAGEMPAGVKRIIKDLTEPKMPWQELLNMSIQSTLKGDYSFMARSKKGYFSDVALPGQTPEETIDIALSMDMSGSISDTMGKEMLSEVRGIMEQFKDFKIKLWCFDTNVYNYAEFTPQNIDELETYPIQGGGGTDFDANWKFMKDNDIHPERFIMFTDGYPWNSWGDPDYCDTVFIIHGNEDIKPPFGNYAYYDEAK